MRHNRERRRRRGWDIFLQKEDQAAEPFEDTTAQAIRALEAVREEGEKADAAWEELAPVARRLEEEYRKNHFIERWELLYGSGDGK